MGGLRDVLAVPFGFILSVLYEFTDNYLLSLILITLVIRLLLLPQAVKQQKNSAKQMRLQAKINKIRAKYSTLNPREAQMKISEETQELYRREGFNASTAGCLPMILQLLVMLGLYGAIYSPLSLVLRLEESVMAEIKTVYNAFINALPADSITANMKSDYYLELNALNRFSQFKDQLNPEIISEEVIARIENFITNFQIFGIDLTDAPSQFRELGYVLILIPVLAGVTAMFTSVYMYLKQRKTNPEMAKNPAMGCMTFMSPVMSIMFSYNLPAGIGFYWIITNILSFIQTVGLALTIKPDAIIAGQMIDETVQRRSREQNVKIKAELMKKHEESNE
ncbi:MAG: YidC/Oxa1 family membrane protein insertase [Clostridia bacterium]|nr:YidC/Oxa1 family membrane protein insertase [Clostridia bacterium]